MIIGYAAMIGRFKVRLIACLVWVSNWVIRSRSRIMAATESNLLNKRQLKKFKVLLGSSEQVQKAPQQIEEGNKKEDGGLGLVNYQTIRVDGILGQWKRL